jgi:hypothetical protein
MYIANVDGFEGDGNLLSKFGVEIRDQANFIVSKKRWNQYIGTRSSGTLGNIRPGEGDLIYLPLSKSLFEIRFVEHESPFYQLSNLPTYTLQCELFEYSGEQIQTGISDIDTAMEDISQQIVMVINNSNGTDFTIGETIQQEIGSSGEYVTARVVSYETVDSSTKKLFVTGWATTDGEYHEFTTDTIDGQTSSAEWTVTDVYNIDDPIANRALTTDPQSRNQEFEVEADGIIDFSESNPFGELGG